MFNLNSLQTGRRTYIFQPASVRLLVKQEVAVTWGQTDNLSNVLGYKFIV